MIKRRIEKILANTISYFPVTGIIGPRQVGKTTLAKEIRKTVDKESIYIDLENPGDLNKITDPILFFENHIDKCVFIDEIQLMPELFSVLRPVVDKKRVAGRFVILGSASPLLLKKSSETLAGRIAYHELTGFNLTELPKGSLSQLWLRGGFPDAFLAPNRDLWLQWIENFIITYIERDLPMLGLNISSRSIRNIWTMIAHVHGNVLNLSTLGRALEMSSPTIKKYLGFLENAFLIRQLQPFFINIRKRLVKSPKVYIRDSGILHYLLGISSQSELEGNPMIGNSWEGFVVEQILQVCDASYQAWFFRTHQGAECDLVLTQSSRPVYAIEIKYSSVPQPTKGNRQAFDDLKAKYNFIITPDSDDYLIAGNIRVCSLSRFLEKYVNQK